MAPIHEKFISWWLYSIGVGLWANSVLAKSNVSTSALDANGFALNFSEFKPTTNGGIAEANFTSRKARSLNCVPMIKLFEVHLVEPLKPGEGVGLTGDHTKLGEWQIDKSLEMKSRRHNPLKWYLKIPMCTTLRIYYRFFIYYKDTRNFKRIRYWEGQQHARVLEAYEIYRYQGSHKFGQAYPLEVGGGVQLERGWLRKEYIIQLKFIWPQHIRFTKFSHFIQKPAYILKFSIYENINGEINYKTFQLGQDIEVHVSHFINMKSKLEELREPGMFYKAGDIVMFQITMADFLDDWYVMSIYNEQQELLGEVIIPSKLIKCSEGILELPIFHIQENRRVGWLTLPFLRIEALPQALQLNMRSSFHHYWPYNWPTLDIGLRGLGKSFYYYSSNAIENTIESFRMAQKVNSDMIQLDVQLTKDYVPIVWSNYGFFTVTSHNNKEGNENHLSYVFIHDLTYQELLKKRVFIFIKGLMVELTHLNTPFVSDKKKFFPQLYQVFQHLSSTLGIVVNIKWPQLLSSGSFESLQSLDKNRYVNELLQITMEFGCGRPLIMASFDADICTMLRFKQHIFPVIFFNMGQHSPWKSYADLRTQSFENAIKFVQASDILGTAVYAQELIPAYNKKHLDMAFELQQLVFVWGDDLSDSSLQDHFREEEMAGLIYDRIDFFLNSKKTKSKGKRFGFFEAPELQRIFLRQCIAAGNLSINEGLPDTHSPFWPRFRSLDEL